jgi:hypothetical protein
LGTTVKVPEAVWTPVKDPVIEAELLDDPEKEWPLIGMGGKNNRGNLQVPGG